MSELKSATLNIHTTEDTHKATMVDPFGRLVTYLRVSVTDRCDFRCVYCMSENMTFLPKKELLTLEELRSEEHTSELQSH